MVYKATFAKMDHIPEPTRLDDQSDNILINILIKISISLHTEVQTLLNPGSQLRYT